jgi:hypothetical protein
MTCCEFAQVFIGGMVGGFGGGVVVILCGSNRGAWSASISLLGVGGWWVSGMMKLLRDQFQLLLLHSKCNPRGCFYHLNKKTTIYTKLLLKTSRAQC